jgi:hypothetical protein
VEGRADAPRRPNFAQFRSAGERRGDQRRRASVCAQAGGFAHPPRASQAVFEVAVDEVADAARHLTASLTAHQPPRDCEVKAEQTRERARRRFA